MSKVAVFNKKGEKTGDLDLNEKIFDARVNKYLLDDVVRLYGNNKRTGNSSTKTFGEVSGGGKKPWKQKGTGRARTSSIRNPIFRGGGIVFGPKPRTIYNAIPKNLRSKALISALSLKTQEQKITVLDRVDLSEPKTKEFYAILKSLDLLKCKVLCVVGDLNETVKRATDNIPNLTVRSAADFNAYHVMRKKKLLLEKGAIETLDNRLKEVI